MRATQRKIRLFANFLLGLPRPDFHFVNLEVDFGFAVKLCLGLAGDYYKGYLGVAIKFGASDLKRE